MAQGNKFNSKIIKVHLQCHNHNGTYIACGEVIINKRICPVFNELLKQLLHGNWLHCEGIKTCGCAHILEYKFCRKCEEHKLNWIIINDENKWNSFKLWGFASRRVIKLSFDERELRCGK